MAGTQGEAQEPVDVLSTVPDPRRLKLRVRPNLQEIALQLVDIETKTTHINLKLSKAEAQKEQHIKDMANLCQAGGTSSAFADEEVILQSLLTETDQLIALYRRQVEVETLRRRVLEAETAALVHYDIVLDKVTTCRDLRAALSQRLQESSAPMASTAAETGNDEPVVEEQVPQPRLPLFLPSFPPTRASTPLPAADYNYGDLETSSLDTSSDRSITPTPETSTTSLPELVSSPAMSASRLSLPKLDVQQPQSDNETKPNELQLDVSELKQLTTDDMAVNDRYQDKSSPVRPPNSFADARPHVQAPPPLPPPFLRSAAPSPSSGAPDAPPAIEAVSTSTDDAEDDRQQTRTRGPNVYPRLANDLREDKYTRTVNNTLHELRQRWRTTSVLYAPDVNKFPTRYMADNPLTVAASLQPPPFFYARIRLVAIIEDVPWIVKVAKIILGLRLARAYEPTTAATAAIKVHAVLVDYVGDMPLQFWRRYPNIALALASAYTCVGMLKQVPLGVKSVLPDSVLDAMAEPTYREYQEVKTGTIVWAVPVPCVFCDFERLRTKGRYKLRACFADTRLHQTADTCSACCIQNKGVACFMSKDDVGQEMDDPVEDAPACAVASSLKVPSKRPPSSERPNTLSTGRPSKRPRYDLADLDPALLRYEDDDQQLPARPLPPAGCSPGDESDMDLSE